MTFFYPLLFLFPQFVVKYTSTIYIAYHGIGDNRYTSSRDVHGNRKCGIPIPSVGIPWEWESIYLN